MSNWIQYKRNNNNNYIDDDDSGSNKNCLFRTITSMPIRADYKYRHVISEKWNDCSLFIANRKLAVKIQIAGHRSECVCARARAPATEHGRSEERGSGCGWSALTVCDRSISSHIVVRSIFRRPKTVRFWIILHKARTIWGEYWGHFHMPRILAALKPNRIAQISRNNWVARPKRWTSASIFPP